MHGAMITQVLDEADPVLGFAVGWVNTLAARVEQLEVICLSHGEAGLAPNVRVTVLPAARFARYRRVRAVLRRLKRGGALNFVLAHMCPSYAVAATVPRRIAPTFLWYAHSSVTRMLLAADRRCDRVFSCSRASYPLESGRLVVVGHGIDTERFAPATRRLGDAPFTLCCVGRIAKSKRLDLLVRALAGYRARRPDACFGCRIVGPVLGPGDEAYFADLVSLIDRSGLGDVVRIDPPVPHEEVVHVYRGADVVANLTRRHSLDKAVLEAMACGCLVLTTNEAYAEVVGEHAGLMVKPDASADALAGAIEALTALSVERRAGIGLELRDVVVREHGLSRMMDRIVEEMRAVANLRGER